MYLTRIKINLSKRETMIALTNPQRFHGAIERAVGTTDERHLWRLDNLGGQAYLLVLSSSMGDWSILQNQFGYECDAESVKTVLYDKLIERVADGGKWHFRLVANPVRSVMNHGSRGKVVNHVTVAQQQDWLMQRCEKQGFRVAEGEFAVVGNKWLHFQKRDNNKVALQSVAFEGTLTVTDVELFRQSLLKGIGRGKAYGLGMLTVTR